MPSTPRPSPRRNCRVTGAAAKGCSAGGAAMPGTSKVDYAVIGTRASGTGAAVPASGIASKFALTPTPPAGRGAVLRLMTAAGLDLAGRAPGLPESQRGHIVQKMSQAIIEMRCTDRLLASFALAVGILAVLAQAVSLLTEHWLHTVEPRPINMTDEITLLQKEMNFQYESGYFRMCRSRFVAPLENITDLALRRYIETDKDFEPICRSNDLFSDEDLSSYSRATASIMLRIRSTSLLHVLSAILSAIATGLGLLGHRWHNNKTIYSGVLYIIAGLAICVSVLQYICVVDDEMAPRMRSTLGSDRLKGEPHYAYDYGYSFFLAAMSFLLIQMAALGHLFLYFRRFPTVEDKCKMVPGLGEKVRRYRIESETAANDQLAGPTLYNNNNMYHASPSQGYRVAQAKMQSNGAHCSSDMESRVMQQGGYAPAVNSAPKKIHGTSEDCLTNEYYLVDTL